MITSLLDTDLYKFKMLYFLWKMNLHNTPVSYKLTNRGDVDPFSFFNINKFEQNIYNLKDLKFSFDELQFLKTLVPNDNFINWLSKLQLGWDQLDRGPTYHGPIGSIILYETPLMAIINQMFTEKVLEGMGRYSKEHEKCFRNKLRAKMFEIADYNRSNQKKLRFTEFGTRRRSSLELQRLAIQTALEICPEAIVGTSNVMLAKELNIKALGTIAHEMFMLYAAIAHLESGSGSLFSDLQCSQIELIQHWSLVFPDTYWLTDTYGTEWFLRNAIVSGKELYGYRQDSGSPDLFMDRLNTYKLLGKGKKIMFSDGLDIHQMINLMNKYKDEDISFGWGTNLTNDGLVEPLRIVIKLHSVKSQPTVKLSDNIKKAVGPKFYIEQYSRAFSYNAESIDITY